VTANVFLLTGTDFDAAMSAVERALSANPSSAAAHYCGALIHAFRGNSSIADAYADSALRLSPFDPIEYLAYDAHGIAAVQMGRLDEAAAHFAKAIQLRSDFGLLYFYHASVLALADRVKEATPIARRGLELVPNWRTRTFSDLGIIPEIADRLTEGARKLGLPE
jgi:adenylate cyclase